MRAVACGELVTSPPGSSDLETEERSHGRQQCVQYLRRNTARSTLNHIPPKQSQPYSPRNREHEELILRSENTTVDLCGRHFLFDTRWTNGIFNRNNFRDETVFLPPVSRNYHIHQSHNLHRFSDRKQLSYGITKPCTFGLFEEYELTSVPSVLVTLTTPPISERNRFSECFNNNRSKKIKKVRNLFSVEFNNKSQSFPDPVLGAPASFVQRLSEISALQAETVCQEKIKNLKKNKRQEA
ncbi:uncharacterized protein si:ch211-171b20.3 [Astyanax mexicanus]|uniref:uncharacterized protein si:ch211-171b20.3 n=1 Tax=Astyanax mexicanus TaxID=7994 RepID=UPI0020CAFEBF|nr:uncharacterized protein si:ch211-171b20.3 [Astyanax mexicanus]